MTFESNGPEGKVRGNATQVYEKYLSLAREAVSSGNRVMAETFFQHAEHYYRVLNDSTDPRPEGAPVQQTNGSDRADDGRGARGNGGYEGPRREPAGDGSEGGARPQEDAGRSTKPDGPGAAGGEVVQASEQAAVPTTEPTAAPAGKDGGSRPRRGRPRTKPTDGEASSEAAPRRGRPRREARAPSSSSEAEPAPATSSGDEGGSKEDGTPPDEVSA